MIVLRHAKTFPDSKHSYKIEAREMRMIILLPKHDYSLLFLLLFLNRENVKSKFEKKR